MRQGTHTQAAESRRVAGYKPGSITGRGAGALEAEPGLPERGPLSPQASTRSGSSTWEEPSAAAEVRAPSPSEPIWDHHKAAGAPWAAQAAAVSGREPTPSPGPGLPARPHPHSPLGRPRAGVHPFPAAARAPHQPPRRRWRRAIPAAIPAAYLLHATARPSCPAPPPGPQAPPPGAQSTPGRFWRRITPLFLPSTSRKMTLRQLRWSNAGRGASAADVGRRAEPELRCANSVGPWRIGSALHVAGPRLPDSGRRREAGLETSRGASPRSAGGRVPTGLRREAGNMPGSRSCW